MSGEQPEDPAEWSPFHDRRGVPICAGDLIRSDHFVDRRRRKHYLYHVAVPIDGRWDMVPAQHLVSALVGQGGRCRMSQEIAGAAEVISGYGPGRYLDYADRPRVESAVVRKNP